MENPMAMCDLFHPSGLRVRMPILLRHELSDGAWVWLSASEMLSEVDRLLSAGWLIEPPAVAGVGEGEHKDLCGWISKSQAKSRFGGYVDVLDLYLPEDFWKKVKVYLNTPEDVAAFQAASGINPKSIPLNATGANLERGKSPGVDAMIFRCPKPFTFIWKNNPDYQEGDKDKAARKFVRWGGQSIPASAGSPQTTHSEPQRRANEDPQDADEVADFVQDFEGCTEEGELKVVGGRIAASRTLTQPGRDELKRLYRDHQQRIKQLADIPF